MRISIAIHAFGALACHQAYATSFVAGVDLRLEAPFSQVRSPTGPANTSDGTAILVADANGILSGLYIDGKTVTVFQDKACFVTSSATFGKEMHCETADSGGPFVIKDIWGGTPGSIRSTDPQVANFNDTWLVWIADSLNEGEEMWAWDGSSDPFLLFGNSRAGTSDADFSSAFVPVDDELLCWGGSTATRSDVELLCWTGARGLYGPEHVFDLAPGTGSSNPEALVVAGPAGNRSLCYGSNLDSQLGKEVYCTNIETGVTMLMLDGRTGSSSGFRDSSSSTPYSFIVPVGDEHVCFSVETSGMAVSSGYYVHCARLDSGASSVVTAADAEPSRSSSRPFDPVAVGNTHICFVVDTSSNGEELFCMDAASGELVMQEHAPGTTDSGFRGQVALGDGFICYGTSGRDGWCWAPGVNNSEPIRLEDPSSGEYFRSAGSGFQIVVPTPGGDIGCFAGASIRPSRFAGVACFNVSGVNSTGLSGDVVPLTFANGTDGPNSDIFVPVTSESEIATQAVAPFGVSGICFQDRDGMGPMCWSGLASDAPFAIALPGDTVPAGGPANRTSA